jgi:release factor glutamine methyltransferase
MTVREFLRETIEKFIKADLPTPRLDAELILSFAIKIKKYKLITDDERELTYEEISELNSFILKRIEGEPVAYITGKKEFYSLDFIVNRDVLIPRPETELLVDLLLFYSEKNSIILDLGTGSGAIAVSLKYNRPDLDIFASDISNNALAVAKNNCRAILGNNSVCFLCGDLLQPFKTKIFNIIVSNPPYLNPELRDDLQREINFEPASALFSDDKGRAVIRKIINDSIYVLKPEGMILIEIAPEMTEFVHEIGMQNNLSVSVFNDYSDKPRVAVFR